MPLFPYLASEAFSVHSTYFVVTSWIAFCTTIIPKSTTANSIVCTISILVKIVPVCILCGEALTVMRQETVSTIPTKECTNSQPVVISTISHQHGCMQQICSFSIPVCYISSHLISLCRSESMQRIKGPASILHLHHQSPEHRSQDPGKSPQTHQHASQHRPSPAVCVHITPYLQLLMCFLQDWWSKRRLELWESPAMISAQSVKLSLMRSHEGFSWHGCCM